MFLIELKFTAIVKGLLLQTLILMLPPCYYLHVYLFYKHADHQAFVGTFAS